VAAADSVAAVAVVAPVAADANIAREMLVHFQKELNMNFGLIRRTTSLLALSLVVTTGLVSSAFAQAGQRLDLDLKDADLVVAIQALTKRSGLQFAIADDPSKFRTITLSLRDATPEEALQTMVASAGAFVERNEAGCYIIRLAKPEAAQTGNSAPAVVAKAPTELRRIRIKQGDPEFIFHMLTSSVTWDQDSGLRNISNFGKDGRRRNSGVTLLGQEAVRVETDLRSQNVGANDIAIPGETANQFQPGGGGGTGAGGFPGGGGAGAGAQGGTQLQAGQGLVPDGIDYLSYDPTDNSIIVQGTDDAIRKLQQAIALFDRAPKQCEVKVEFITTSQNATRSFGVDWTFNRGAIAAGNDPGRFASTSDPIFVNFSTGNLVTSLRTQLLEGRGKVVSAPLVRTFNNQTARVSSTIQTTYFTALLNNGPSGVTTTYQANQQDITTELIVRPRINDDGTITMTLNPRVEDLGQVRVGPDGQEVPDILSQELQVATRVKNGETIVLGGLTRKSTQGRSTRYPVLGDLPLIGQFFRTTSTSRDDSELLIFVTARVLEDDSDLGFNP